MATESTVRIGLIYPEVLGTYGDSGNSLVLQQRLVRRGIPAEVVTVDLDTKVPSDLDIYTLGGGEDAAQIIATDRLRSQKGLSAAISKGAPVLAVCAALQIMGKFYADRKGNEVRGLELLDVATVPRETRATGELVTEPLLPGLTLPLTGFENHGGGTALGPDALPLGNVISGIGNGAGHTPPQEGAVQGSIIGTYLHGPALARNPELADYLLQQVVGSDLEPIEISGLERLRDERLREQDPATAPKKGR